MPKIHFYLRFSSGYGQRFFIGGNIPELGDLDAAKAIPMEYLNHDTWYAQLDLVNAGEEIRYKYILRQDGGDEQMEWPADKFITPEQQANGGIALIDHWSYPGDYQNVLSSEPFKEILLNKDHHNKPSPHQHSTHCFRVKNFTASQDETVIILGHNEELGHWDETKGLAMNHTSQGWFEVCLDLSKSSFPLVYKYAVRNNQTGHTTYETGDNRSLSGYSANQRIIVHDGAMRGAQPPFKGAGIAIPVFSLRTANGLGTGEFEDLKSLADWCGDTGLKLIQLLPINDTTATWTWKDSYPYSAISAFALHPLYLNLEKLAGEKYQEQLDGIAELKKELNSLAELDYEKALQEKWKYIRSLYALMKAEWIMDPDYLAFFETHKYWLKPYAAFCYLRDKHKTVAFSEWGKFAKFSEAKIEKLFGPNFKDAGKVEMHLFIQWHLHRQLSDAVEYAHSKGVIVKGDLPIGIYRNSCDAWQEPGLFNMHYQAGAPPDDFARHGQNWSFPTYNWKQMAEDGFSWWKKRFSQMSLYFDAFRIDHILGFFRIWSIPIESLEGIMGFFVPAIPVHRNEFNERGIWFDHKRYTQPFMPALLVDEAFGDFSTFAKETFLEDDGWKFFRFKPEFDSQRKIADWFSENADTEGWIKEKLFDFHSNIILLQNPEDDADQYHFRIAMEQTTSYQWLDDDVKWKLKELYNDYYFQRQDQAWKEEAMRKLPELKASTDMMICGEDLGMVPACVPGVMKDLGLLSLEIQRMPKNPNIRWFHPADAPYLSVVTPSTHDMSTLREWWEEDPASSRRFYNEVLGYHGEAPFYCEPWIATAIIRQHIHSSAMWSIFQVQDLLATTGQLRRENPLEERINVPADPNHYWRYRMHISIESLLEEIDFNEGLKGELKMAGRN